MLDRDKVGATLLILGCSIFCIGAIAILIAAIWATAPWSFIFMGGSALAFILVYKNIDRILDFVEKLG